MKLLPGLVAVLATASLATSANAAVNLIVNGGFETGINPAGSTELATGSTAIFGWTVLSKGASYVDETVWDAASGDRSVELGIDAGKGGLFQRVGGFNVGSKYRLTFDMSANPFDPAGLPRGSRSVVSVSGGAPALYNYTVTSFNSPSNMLYTTATYEFFASSKFQNVQFRSLNNSAYATVIDNVSISAVPEASTWVMLIAGFGMVGLASRQRKRLASKT